MLCLNKNKFLEAIDSMHSYEELKQQREREMKEVLHVIMDDSSVMLQDISDMMERCINENLFQTVSYPVKFEIFRSMDKKERRRLL